MPWNLKFDEHLALIDAELSGTLTPQELDEFATRGIAAARAHGTRLFLTDCARLTGGHSVFDLFSLAERLSKLGLPRGSREALIMPTASDAGFDAEFWQNACSNRGFEVRGFATREAALAWLVNAHEAAEPA